MVKVIGRGTSAVRDFIARCKRAGGIPQLVTHYKGKPWSEWTGIPGAILVRCWGRAKEVPGGIIGDVPSDVVEELKAEI
ncbi:MAG: hypothetical protein DRP01_00795 [Archaeoglobales archaeon]|nr:MAG: hypothetical protein DRP01_00795 [Archaeoglobales archaeon]